MTHYDDPGVNRGVRRDGVESRMWLGNKVLRFGWWIGGDLGE